MKNNIAILTDTHHGIRNSSKVFREMQMNWYETEFFPTLEAKGIQTVLHLGDLFDSRTSVSLHDLDATMNRFLPLLDEYKVHMTIIAGNHDVAFRNTNKVNSLSVLKQHPRITVVEDHIELVKLTKKTFVLCPWLNEENEETLLEQLKFYANDDHILGMHGEFKDMKMYKNSKVCDHGLSVNQFKNFHKVVSGHFHHPSTSGNLSYLGAAFHFNWQDWNDWRGFHIYHDDTDEWEAIENTHSLFTSFDWYDDLNTDTDDKTLQPHVQGKFVRIVLTDDYDKVILKDFVNRCEQFKPVSVDIIDNTILESYMLSEEEDELDDDGSKTIDEYAHEALEQHSRKTDLLELFSSIKEEASSKMIEIE